MVQALWLGVHFLLEILQCPKISSKDVAIALQALNVVCLRLGQACQDVTVTTTQAMGAANYSGAATAAYNWGHTGDANQTPQVTLWIHGLSVFSPCFLHFRSLVSGTPSAPRPADGGSMF